jgi:hypothetical protein
MMVMESSVQVKGTQSNRAGEEAFCDSTTNAPLSGHVSHWTRFHVIVLLKRHLYVTSHYLPHPSS